MSAAAPASESTLAKLEAITQGFADERVTVGEFVDHLEGHAIGIVLLLLALPMCVPNVPGISTIFGVLLLAPSIQLMIGSQRLWLPRYLRTRSFSREALAKTISAAAPTLRWAEKIFRPRAQALTGFPFTAFFGLQTLILALVLILPIPGGNWPPSMAIAIMSLALMQRDGLMAIFSTICAALSVIAAYFFFYAGVVAFQWLWDATVKFFGG